MAKRSRVTGRPGQRRPIDRTVDRVKPDSVPNGGLSLTESELARAAELEAPIVAEEKASEAASRRTAAIRGRGRTVVSSEPLSVRAAHEYAYVARDVRRIGLVASIMFGALIALHLLINVFGVFAI